MVIEPPIERTRPATPLENRLNGIYRSGMTLVVASIIGFLFYAGVGSLLQYVFPRSSYPFVVFGSDPVIYVFMGVTGVLICISMGALAFLALLSSENENRKIVIVLLCSIAIGFGGAAGYYAFDALLGILGV